MAEWLRMNQIHAVVIIIMISIAAAGGWLVNGWRLSGQIAGKDAEITSLSGELTRQNDSIAVLGREASAAQAKASAAQAEASKLRKRSSAKVGVVQAIQASSCAEVLRDQWGKL